MKERKKLFLLLLFSFPIRLLPHRTLLLATYDEYLHRDITLRLASRGLLTFSHSITSILGLKAYSYPPLFHIIGAAFYRIFPSQYLFFILPPIYGTLATLMFYFAFKEILEAENNALLATFLLSFSPNFIYRTSLYIPENLGLVLFGLNLYLYVRFLKGEKKYLALMLLTFPIYMMTHRSWVFFALVAFLLWISCRLDLIVRYLHLWLATLVGAVIAYKTVGAINSLLEAFFVRIQKTEVSFLGYFKWIGVVQLVFGVLETSKFIKGKGLQRGIALWAWVFLLAGGISFRFRDPYASIPLSVMAAEFLSTELPTVLKEFLVEIKSTLEGPFSTFIQKWILKRKIVSLLISFLLLGVTFQGVYGAYYYIQPPTIKDKQAYEWITKNTPKNATILVWWDMGYLLIGNTHRKDVVIWKKVYQGFFSAAPTPKQAMQAYTDSVVMFTSPQRERVFFLMRKYNVSYIFIDKKRLGYGLIRYGLMEYAPYDTHFKLVFCNGGALIYHFVPFPKLRPSSWVPLNYSGKFKELVKIIEEFWTGYNYADFDNSYKADVTLNAWIIRIYGLLYNETGYSGFKEREEWLQKWLVYEQLKDGSFPAGVPPNHYTLYTALTIEPLHNIGFNGTERAVAFLKKMMETNLISTYPGSNEWSPVVSSLVLPVYVEYGIRVNPKILKRILEEQGGDGSWNNNVGTTVAIAAGLARYYQETRNETVLKAVVKAAKWLTQQQKETGELKIEKNFYDISRSTYAELAYVQYVAGLKKSFERTWGYLVKTYDPNRESSPLRSIITIYRYLSYIYGGKKALEILDDLLTMHPLLKSAWGG